MAFLHPQIITSIKNPHLQLVRSILNDTKTRKESGLFVLEGVRLAEEAHQNGVVLHSAFYSSALSERGKKVISEINNGNLVVYEVDETLLGKISSTENSQGIILVAQMEKKPIPPSTDLVLILDSIRDPGNMGTIMRSAAASGVKIVLLSPGCVDAYNPKVVRSAMGAHFRLNIQQMDWLGIGNYCKHELNPPLHILLADAHSQTNLWNADMDQPIAVIIGSEADGASHAALTLSDEIIHIPMPGGFESLNAGVAASIILFEVTRQRKNED